jgi:uncharacterized protein (TIGR02001 family)
MNRFPNAIPGGLVLAAVLATAPAAAQAQDIAVLGGLALTSDYVSDGLTQTEGDPAAQAYLELDTGLFYAGAWISNVSFPDSPEDVELDLYLGLRGETPQGLGYDLSYYRYFYDGDDCCGEIIGALYAPIAPAWTLGGQLSYDTDEDDFGAEVSPGYAVSDALTLTATMGYKDSYDGIYGDIGGTWAVTDSAAIDLRYHDADVAGADGILALTFSIDTQFAGP